MPHIQIWCSLCITSHPEAGLGPEFFKLFHVLDPNVDFESPVDATVRVILPHRDADMKRHFVFVT